MAATALATPQLAEAQLLEWAAITNGRMIDIHDFDRSDEHRLAAALSLANVARAVRENDADVRGRIAEQTHYRVVTFINEGSTSTQVLIVRDNTTAVVAVRGSIDNVDFLLNAAAVTTDDVADYPDAHTGFVTAARSVDAQVSREVSRLLTQGVRQIWFTGHSLGGAVAQLLAFRLEGWGFPVELVMTFGAPAVGKGVWAHEYARLAGRTHRFETNADMVACVPPESQGWRQNGALHVLHPDGVSMFQAESRCARTFNVHPDAHLCDDAGVKWAAMVFGGMWHLELVCRMPDPFDAAFNFLAGLSTGQGFDHHGTGHYWDRIAGEIPHLIRRLTGR